MVGGVRTQVVSDLESFERLAAAWDDLLETIGTRHPQLEHDWLAAWWRHFGASDRVRVVLLWRDDRLVAALPLRHARARVAGVPVRELRLLENNETTRGPVLMARDDADAARTLMAAVMAQPGWDRLYWRNLADPEGAPRLLAGAARQAGLLATVSQDLMVPVLPLAATWEEFVRSLPRGRRRDMRRARNRAQKRGGYRVIIHQSAGAELEAALGVIRRLAEASWQHTEAGTSVVSRPDFWAFYRDISGRAAREGRLLLAISEVAGEPAGFDLALRSGDTVYLLKTGFDPRFRACAPGRLQVIALMRHSVETGGRVLDFMGMAEDFKEHWGCQICPQVMLIATRRRLLPMTAHLLRHIAAPALARTAPLAPVVRWLRGRGGLASQRHR